jgi:methionine-rich copper-binding protein CopC/putative copper export protein
MNRKIVALLTLCAALLMSPAIAWAHAHLKRSAPAANAVLSTSPTAIRLWFSEAPELSLTKVSLSDSTGKSYALGTPVQDVDGKVSVRVRVTEILGAGLYKVEWATTAVDGHPSQGSFSFRVSGAAAAPVPSTTSPQAVPDVHILDSVRTSTVSPLAPVARVASFASLLALIGAVTFCLAVLPRVRSLGAETTASIEARVASRGAIAAAAYLTAALALLYFQRAAMIERGVSMQQMSTTHWLAMWKLQLGSALVAGLGLLVARRRGSGGWLIAAAACVVLAVGVALGGHAGASDNLHVVSVGGDTLHVLAAAGWMGSLLWLAVVGLPLVHASGDGRAVRVAALVNAFSPVALGSASLLVATGVMSAWLRLGSLSALWVSPYGNMLLRKLFFVAAVAVVGSWNWRRIRPSLGSDDASARLRRSAWLELGFAVVVLVFTALLVSMPTPDMPG